MAAYPCAPTPLTWRDNGGFADRSLHVGAVPILAHLFLPSLDLHLVDSYCEDGILYVSHPPSEKSGYIADIDGGELGCCGRMHAFDFPLFWRNIRLNAIDRVNAYTGSLAVEEEECLVAVAIRGV